MTEQNAFAVVVAVDEQNVGSLGRRYRLSPTGSTLGNVGEADIPLQFESEQPFLVRIFKEKGRWYLVDLTEQSNVRINDLIAQHNQLFDRDVFRIGSFSFEFCSGMGVKAEYFEHVEGLIQEDFLTHAFNRSFLFHLLRLELIRYNRAVLSAQKQPEQGPPTPISLVFLDTDHFGQLNKTHGHLVGDEILKELVQRIKSRLRSTDIVARYGGEEFIVVLFDTTLLQAKEVAESIRSVVASSAFLTKKGDAVPVTISIGVAELEPGMSVEDFIAVADKKVRQAKSEGRNRVIF